MTPTLADPRAMPHTSGEEEVFEAYLRKQGLKYTPARKQLLRSIFAVHDHFTAEQLIERLRVEGIPASKATVYRTLAVMLACGILVMHDFGEGARYYEHTYGHAHHDHFFCVGCKAIKEFRDERIESLQDEVARKMGGELLAHSLKLYGLCGTCRNDPTARERGRSETTYRG